MSRKFIFLAHQVPVDGNFTLDDLPSLGGRVDVICRNLQAAFSLSHGIRQDVTCYVVVTGPPSKIVRIEGSQIKHLNPDERSTAARIQQALRAPGTGPDWHELQSGLAVAELELEDLLEELRPPFIKLDPSGTPLAKTALPANCTFVLSDHVPFTEAEDEALALPCQVQVSLGDVWYHGNHAVAVIHQALDDAHGPSPVR